MKIKYLIYFFTFSLMLSFSIFLSSGLIKAQRSYHESRLNLYKIQRTKELSEAFQATLYAHRIKRLSLINHSITQTQLAQVDQLARTKLAQLRPHIDSDISRQLGVRQKIAMLSMLKQMDKLLDNDNLQLSHLTNSNANLFNINSAYYIYQTSKSFYRYTYDTRMLNADSFLFLEAIRLNNRLNMSLTELIDQIIDVKLNNQVRKDSYLRAIQLTGILSALNTRLTFMKLAYNDVETTSIVNQLLEQVSKSQTDHIVAELYNAITHQAEYHSDFVYHYIKDLSQLSQSLYQRSFELEAIASQQKIYTSQTEIDGMIALAFLIALFILLPSLSFSSNMSRWLTKTQSNILRLSRGDMNIDNHEELYNQELMAISDAIKQLKQYQQEKGVLENEKHQLIKELEASSFLDPLTNIYNRRKFFREYEALDNNSYPLVVCLIDIDNFKVLNDTYGHDIGDRVLVAFSHLLRKTLRTDDIFCRYGGEEFAVILRGCTPENARHVMEELRQQVNQINLPLADEQQVRFTISVGIAVVNAFKQLQAAIKQADDALYFCKKSGKDRVSIYTPAGFL